MSPLGGRFKIKIPAKSYQLREKNYTVYITSKYLKRYYERTTIRRIVG